MPDEYGKPIYNILFHEEQFDLICEYQDQIGVDTIQEAIMAAIKDALERA